MAATDDVDRVNRVLARLDRRDGRRRADAIDNPHVRAVLLARRGWSDAKIARAMADRRKAAERAPRHERNDTAEYWRTLLVEVRDEFGLRVVSLMHHDYRKNPDDEPFAVVRVAAGSLDDSTSVFAAMPDGVVHDFM